MACGTVEPLVDSHCHLDLSAFGNDTEAVIKRAVDSGVQRILIPGTTQQGWLRQKALSQAHNSIDNALGLHPYFLTADWRDAIANMESLISGTDFTACAIGEIGLDAVIDVPYSLQLSAFEAQVDIAMAMRMPVILHHRKTQHELLRVIKQRRFAYGGILHAFSGSAEAAQRFVDAGFLLGVGGTITYPRGSKTREALKSIDMKHLVLETDSPDMPLYGKQGKRNEPHNIVDVCKALAHCKGLSVDAVAQQTTRNYFAFVSRSV